MHIHGLLKKIKLINVMAKCLCGLTVTTAELLLSNSYT